MNWTPTQLAFADSCREFGPQVAPLPDGIDGTQLLWAMGGNESSFGENVKPRHEPAFDIGGLYCTSGNMPGLLHAYGSAAACSYGPLQVMYTNVAEMDDSVSPDDLSDVQVAMRCSVGYLNHQLGVFRPTSLVAIGQIWNGGHPMLTMGPGVAAYVTKLLGNYVIPIPEAV